MKFDIESTLKSMVSAATDSAGTDLKEVKDTAQQFFEMNKARYGKLVTYRISGDIDQADFESRMEDEKKMLEAQLNTLAIISKIMAQNAANAAIDVLKNAVQLALKL